MTEVLRYAAFTRDPAGGNPAGVVLDAGELTEQQMQAVAAEVGYSETAFLRDRPDGDVDVRYFSPRAEVPFCGHATVAAAVARAERQGPGLLRLRTRSGLVQVTTREQDAGLTATLVSVPPEVRGLPDDDLDELLAALRWQRADLDRQLPPRLAYAGAWHPVVAVAEHDVLRRLDYDYDRLDALMAARGWTTVQLVHRIEPLVFAARDPFPPGGVVEDPATGAAAAALGAYLRALAAVTPPARVLVLQGEELGRPGRGGGAAPPGAAAAAGGTGAAVALPDQPKRPTLYRSV